MRHPRPGRQSPYEAWGPYAATFRFFVGVASSASQSSCFCVFLLILPELLGGSMPLGGETDPFEDGGLDPTTESRFFLGDPFSRPYTWL